MKRYVMIAIASMFSVVVGMEKPRVVKVEASKARIEKWQEDRVYTGNLLPKFETVFPSEKKGAVRSATSCWYGAPRRQQSTAIEWSQIKSGVNQTVKLSDKNGKMVPIDIDGANRVVQAVGMWANSKENFQIYSDAEHKNILFTIADTAYIGRDIVGSVVDQEGLCWYKNLDHNDKVLIKDAIADAVQSRWELKNIADEISKIEPSLFPGSSNKGYVHEVKGTRFLIFNDMDAKKAIIFKGGYLIMPQEKMNEIRDLLIEHQQTK